MATSCFSAQTWLNFSIPGAQHVDLGNRVQPLQHCMPVPSQGTRFTLQPRQCVWPQAGKSYLGTNGRHRRPPMPVDTRNRILCCATQAGGTDQGTLLTTWQELVPKLSKAGLDTLERGPLEPSGLETLKEGEYKLIIQDPQLSSIDVAILNMARRKSWQHNLHYYPSLVPTDAPDIYDFKNEHTGGVGQQTFFVDQDGTTEKTLQRWLALNESIFRSDSSPGARLDVLSHMVVSGFTGTGKSFIVQRVIPALLKASPTFGVGQPAEALVCVVDLSSLDQSDGLRGFMLGLLLQLNRWASAHGLGQVAVPLSESHVALFEDALESFFSETLDKDRLFYLGLDELQTIFSSTVSRKPSESDIEQARVVLRLILRQPSHVLVAVTGSSMAAIWSNLMKITSNERDGFPGMQTLSLTASNLEPAALALIWARLKSDDKARGAELPDALLRFSPEHAAMLCGYIEQYVGQGMPADVMTFVRDHEERNIVKK